jgi:hypothetical protein
MYPIFVGHAPSQGEGAVHLLPLMAHGLGHVKLSNWLHASQVKAAIVPFVHGKDTFDGAKPCLHSGVHEEPESIQAPSLHETKFSTRGAVQK